MEWLIAGALAYFFLSGRTGAGAAPAESAPASTGGIASPRSNPPGTPGMDTPGIACSPGYIPSPICLATNRIEIDPANPSCAKCVPLFTPVPIGGGFIGGVPIRRLF